jgi:hypothetical protein
MPRNALLRLALLVAASLAVTPAPAPAQPDPPAALQARQREALAAFARMDGVWRGPAWTMTPQGRHELTQTERVGTFLDGTVRVVEGRGYEPDGTVSFNALGIISFDPQTNRYTITSWAMGRTGRFEIRPTADGYTWETPAGPGAVIRYTATIRDGEFREVGHRIVGDAPPVQIFEMNLRRVGDTDWPAGNPVPMR